MGILYLGQISFLCQSYHMPLNTHKLKPRKVKRGGVDLIEGEFCTYAAHQYHFTPPWTFIIFSFFIDGFYVVLQFLLHGPTPLFSIPSGLWQAESWLFWSIKKGISAKFLA